MKFSSTASVLQLLDGSKLHVLIALFATPSLPVGEQAIASTVGCDRKTARKHLAALAALGLVARGGWKDKETWTLTTEAYQLPLPFVQLQVVGKSYPQLVEGEATPADSNGDVGKSYPHSSENAPQAETAEAVSSPGNEDVGNFYPHLPYCCCYKQTNKDSCFEREQQQQNGDVGKSYPQLTQTILRRVRIQEPSLSEMEAVCPAVSLAWVWSLMVSEVPERIFTGTLVNRLRDVLKGGLLPEEGFLQVAGFWLALSDEEYRELQGEPFIWRQLLDGYIEQNGVEEREIWEFRQAAERVGRVRGFERFMSLEE